MHMLLQPCCCSNQALDSMLFSVASGRLSMHGPQLANPVCYTHEGAVKEGVAPSAQPASKRAKVDKPARQAKKSMLLHVSMPALFQRDSTKQQVSSMAAHTLPCAYEDQSVCAFSSLLHCEGVGHIPTAL